MVYRGYSIRFERAAVFQIGLVIFLARIYQFFNNFKGLNNIMLLLIDSPTQICTFPGMPGGRTNLF